MNIYSKYILHILYINIMLYNEYACHNNNITPKIAIGLYIHLLASSNKTFHYSLLNKSNIVI